MTQGRFVEALLDPKQPVPPGILMPDGTPASRRFNVYRNNVIVSLIDALGDGFPVVRKLVGDAFFRAMARGFAVTNLPSTPLIFRYGDRFPTYIDNYPTSGMVPYLGDVARLEWARREALHAADAQPCSMDRISDCRDDLLSSLRFEFLPSVRIVQSDFPVLTIWQVNSDSTPSSDRIRMEREDVLLGRPEMDVAMRRLRPGEYCFLEPLLAGETLGTAAERAAKIDGFDLVATLTGLFESRLIHDIRLDGDVK